MRLFTEHSIKLTKERGFTLFESLFLILYLSVLCLGIAYSNIVSFHTTNKSRHKAAALKLAVEKMEEYAWRDPLTLPSLPSVITENKVVEHGMIFIRTTGTSVDPVDRTRRVVVTVTSKNPSIGTSVTISNAFPKWGVS